MSLTLYNQAILSQIIQKNDKVIDATVGNGHDTLFLANLVGENGIVYGFDIQSEAIQKTYDKLKSANLLRQVDLHLIGHENMNRVIPKNSRSKIKAILFNLGYLPRHSHTITTSWKSTFKAIQIGLQYLSPTGILSIIAYNGHPQGLEETLKLDAWLEKQKQNADITVQTKKADSKNPMNRPCLFLIQKKR